MKKTTTVMLTALMATICFARPIPHRPIPHRPIPHRPLAVHHQPKLVHPPVHHHSVWGRGGRNFWPGFTVGIASSLLMPPPPPPPRPVVYVNQVWVPPVYETRPVYDAFGNIIRYEQVLVRAGYWR